MKVYETLVKACKQLARDKKQDGDIALVIVQNENGEGMTHTYVSSTDDLATLFYNAFSHDGELLLAAAAAAEKIKEEQFPINKEAN